MDTLETYQPTLDKTDYADKRRRSLENFNLSGANVGDIPLGGILDMG